MGWGSKFLNGLRGSYAPMLIAESIRIPNGPSGIAGVASHPGLGLSATLTGPVRIDGASADTVNCRATAGGFSFRVLEPVGNLFNSWVPGSLIQLRMGWPGMAANEFEIIALGQLVSMTGPGPAWTVECWDLFSALASRIILSDAGVLDTVSELPLFHNTGTATTLSADYTAGAGTIVVGSVAGFDSETGGSYLLLITPTTGDPFYLTATGTSGGPPAFTGLSAVGALGSTAVDAVTGDAVEEVAYLAGHPADIVRRLLMSTGSGANGTWDDYPADWGWGLPAWMVDDIDISRWKTVLSGYTAVDIAELEPIDEAFAWLEEWLSSIGCWLAIRQGEITFRALQNVLGQTYHTGATYTDGDIIEVLEHEAWDTQREREYRAIAVTIDELTPPSVSSATEAVGGLPAGDRFDVDMVGLHTTITDANDVRDRRKVWVLRRPEALTLRMAGLGAMRHCPGDVVDISITRSFGRRRDSLGLTGRAACVVQVSPNLFENYVDMRVELPPTWGGEFGP